MAINDNEPDNRESKSERIFIPTPSRQGGPILDGYGYQRFTGSTFVLWFLVAGFFWYFKFDLQASKEILTSIASASVEIAGLSLAVLGILHEFNKQDRWFKLGLFLVAILFGYVVLSGFFIVLTWEPDYDAVQHVTVVVVFFLAFATVLQADWYTLIEKKLKPKALNLSKLRKVRLRNLRLSIPFFLPLLFIFLPNINRLTGTLILFCGALIALLCLMGVTTYSLIRNPQPQVEDPLISVSREKIIAEADAVRKTENLHLNILSVLRSLQEVQQKKIDSNNSVSLIDENDIINRLRQQNNLEPREKIREALRKLTNNGDIYSESYSGPYWIVPDINAISEACEHIQDLVFVVTQRENSALRKDDFYVDGYKVTNLREWLAMHAKLPIQITGEFIMPKAMNLLLKDFSRVTLNRGQLAFVNKEWNDNTFSWQDAISEGITDATYEWIKSNRSSNEVLKKLYQTGESPFLLRDLNRNGLLSSMLGDEEFQTYLFKNILIKLSFIDDGDYRNSYIRNEPLELIRSEEAKKILFSLNPTLNAQIRKTLDSRTTG